MFVYAAGSCLDLDRQRLPERDQVAHHVCRPYLIWVAYLQQELIGITDWGIHEICPMRSRRLYIQLGPASPECLNRCRSEQFKSKNSNSRTG